MSRYLNEEGLEVVKDKVNEARETAAGAMALAQQAIDNVGSTRYSTTEQDTGNTWIDGKKIYRRSYSGPFTSVDTSNTNRLIANYVMTGTNAETIVNAGGYYNRNSITNGLQKMSLFTTAFNSSGGLQSSCGVSIDSNNDIDFGFFYDIEFAPTVNDGLCVWVEYTKTTN